MVKNILLVGLGGSVGAMLRYLLSIVIKSGDFPLATFIINVVGSLTLGMIMASTIDNPSSGSRLLLATGLCGGFTTFSAFAYENMALLQSGKYEMALLYIVLSIVLSVAATWLGFVIFQP